MNDRLNALLTELGCASLQSLVQLHAHASYRTYYRANLTDGSSLVVMVMPQGMASASEEITNAQGVTDELPFVQIGRALATAELPVPRVRHFSAADNWLLLEDLGDMLLANAVADADIETLRTWYRRAIDLLAELQRKGSGLRVEGCIALRRSFDATLLNWEFDHFREFGLMARLPEPPREAFFKTFQQWTRKLTDQILEMSYCFTHRDFQSRNLIVHHDRLFMLDFQDALRGPYVYDLVALLRDSYVELPQELVYELVDYFAEKSGRDPKQTRLDFHRVTVQRKLKDAGRFVYIDRVKGNPDFLPFIPTSLRYVRAALEQIPEGPALYEVMKPYVPEWKE
ncbi:MAG: phosphotransferase [Deltaproteobacteria bacterium]|nr:phosphotransferase [Deltaproteobacteria bacterium]